MTGQGVWGKWCKILHFNHHLASDYCLKYLIFMDIFNKHLTKFSKREEDTLWENPISRYTEMMN